MISASESEDYSESDSDDYEDSSSDADSVTSAGEDSARSNDVSPKLVPDYVCDHQEHELREGPLSEQDAKKMAAELKRASAYSLLYRRNVRDKKKTLKIQCTRSF